MAKHVPGFRVPTIQFRIRHGPNVKNESGYGTDYNAIAQRTKTEIHFIENCNSLAFDERAKLRAIGIKIKKLQLC